MGMSPPLVCAFGDENRVNVVFDAENGAPGNDTLSTHKAPRHATGSWPKGSPHPCYGSKYLPERRLLSKAKVGK